MLTKFLQINYPGNKWHGAKVRREELAQHTVDPQCGFTPLCPNELPVPNGHLIVEESLRTHSIVGKKTISKDAHPTNAFHRADESHPVLSKVEGHKNLDLYWPQHCVVGTEGFELIPGLPHVTEYDMIVYKGAERDLHPYGACYHDAAKKVSTGIIEFYKLHGSFFILVDGLAAEYCVFETCVELMDAGFQLIINAAATMGVTEDGKSHALARLAEKGAMIFQNADEILGMMIEEDIPPPTRRNPLA